ncbi:uncharacterized protein LOC125582140 [Brassica napus]|uniref:uncharacterized protein LOC125582140 n=1 Tax=Brassica napus TaxID=3708 RepID=UPI002078E9EF|nr:uncharacterized protein LOC125582140 [Brassica napus]
MITRSISATNIVPRVEDIRALEREIARQRREVEQQAHLQRLEFDMENLPQDGDALGGINPRADHLRPQRQPQHLPRQARAIGAYDQPHINENNKYHGLAAEDPFDHLYKFDKYCGLSKANGVSEDAFNLKLFPFSLGDKAHQWEITLPSDTKGLESFSEAWERFKGYWSQCPHHGFSKESLFSTFYRGALPQCRNRLDTASNGFFLGKTEEEAEELVENMAKSDSVYSEEHDRVNRSDDQQTKKEIKSLQEKIYLLLSNQAKQEQMNFVGGPSQEVPPKVNEIDGLEGQEELCFINNNGTWYRKKPNFQYNNYEQRSYSNNQQGGYQPKQNTQRGSYQPRQNIPPGFNNHSNQCTQAQGSSSQAPASDTSVDVMFKKLLDFQPSRQQRSLPGKPEQNLKETMKAITLRSGRELPPRVLTKDGEKQGGEVAINIDDEVVIVDEKVDEEILEKIVEAKGKGKLGEEKRTVKHGEIATPTKESSFVPPPYEPKLSFPGRFKRQLLEKYKTLFEKQKSEYSKFLKDVVGAKKKEMEGMMILTHECSAIIQRLDVPRKLEDPGCFTLPCALGPMVFERSVNIPVGIPEDFPVMVGNFEIPTDFVVLEMGEEARDPLILGRPFLATAGAIVNVREGKIDLHLGKGNILQFDINEVMKKPTIQN